MPVFLKQWLPSILFVLFGLPLILQDLKDSSVSFELLLAILLAWILAAIFSDQAVQRLLAASIVLLIGTLLFLVLPGRLGEADVLFMSGMALIFSFWPLMIALALGCVAGLAAFMWHARGGRTECLSYPLPLLPSLYWGGLTVVLGRIWS